MKLSKTGIRELRAQYRAVLKKCLMINMGLILIASAAYAETVSGEKIYDNGLNINTDNSLIAEAAKVLVEGDVTVSDGSLVLNNSGMEVIGNLIVTGGTITFNNNPEEPYFDYGDGETGLVELLAKNINISGGTINLNNKTSLNTMGDMNIKNATIHIKENAGLWGVGNITLNEGANIDMSDGSYVIKPKVFNMVEGQISMNGSSIVSESSLIDSVTGDNHYLSSHYKGGDLVLSGGQIDVHNGQNNLVGQNISVGNRINIHKGAQLSAFKDYYDIDTATEWKLEMGDKGTVTLTDTGVIDLAGTLNADITGDGTLVLSDAGAVVDGGVDGVNLNINSNIKVADVFKGTLSNLKTTTVLGGHTLNLGTTAFNTSKFAVQDNGTVAFQVSGKDAYGFVQADEYAVSSNGTNLTLTLDNGVLEKGETATFTVFKNQDGTTADVNFANLSQNARYEFVKNEDGTYNITGLADAIDVVTETGADDNVQNVADAWLDQTVMPEGSKARAVQAHLNTLSQTDVAAFEQAVEALMPETAPMAHSMAQSLNNHLAGMVKDRFNVTANRRGMNSGDNGASSSLWAQGLYNKSKLDTDYGFDGKTYGLAMGVDGDITRHLKMGVGYAYANSDIDSTGRQTDANTHTAMVYGQYTVGKVFVNALASYGRTNYDEHKNVSGVRVDADYDMDAVYGQLMGGYRGKIYKFAIMPEAGLRYLWTKMHDYTDTADQHVRGNTTDTLTGVIGLRAGADTRLIGVNGITFQPEISVRATYDMLNDKDTSVVRLANGTGYVVQGETLERFGVEAGAKLGMTVGNVEMSLDYQGRFKKDYTDHTGLVNLKYNF